MLQEKGGAHGDGSKIAYEDLLNFFREDRVNTRLLSTDLDEDAEEEEEEEPAEVMPARVRRKMERERIKQVMQQSLASRGKRSVSNFERKVYFQKQRSLQRTRTGVPIIRQGGSPTKAAADAGPSRGPAQADAHDRIKHTKTY